MYSPVHQKNLVKATVNITEMRTKIIYLLRRLDYGLDGRGFGFRFVARESGVSLLRSTETDRATDHGAMGHISNCIRHMFRRVKRLDHEAILTSIQLIMRGSTG
jgi:hypothetical protein